MPLPLPSSAPLIFLSVCHLWSDIAVSTASLWTSLRVESSPKQGFLETWFARARSLPLDLSLSPHINNWQTHKVVKQYAHQVQILNFVVRFPDELREIMTPFPSLERLTVIVIVGGFVYLDAFMESLRHAPLLVECQLINMNKGGIHRTTELLTLPHLRHLRLGNPNSDGSEEVNTATILRRLTLPALETLFLSTLDIPDDDFTSFLVRSSPPLQSLYISMIEDELTGMDFLHFIPGLNDFTLRFRYYSDREIPMLETIASGRSLPKLRHFTIRDWLLYDRDQESMIDALSSRHTHTLDSEQLESFRLILLGRPKDDLILAWRELAKDRGLNIHVGSLEENYI